MNSANCILNTHNDNNQRITFNLNLYRANQYELWNGLRTHCAWIGLIRTGPFYSQWALDNWHKTQIVPRGHSGHSTSQNADKSVGKRQKTEDRKAQKGLHARGSLNKCDTNTQLCWQHQPGQQIILFPFDTGSTLWHQHIGCWMPATCRHPLHLLSLRCYSRCHHRRERSCRHCCPRACCCQCCSPLLEPIDCWLTTKLQLPIPIPISIAARVPSIRRPTPASCLALTP